MFSKVLIANRGEIACRIMRSCRTMGIRTVAVYSEADAAALHVRMADEAVSIGPPPARESYLSAEKIIAAAKQTQAEAIHPGYGFLAENEEFASACQDAGLVFIGPSTQAIRAMGSKMQAKQLMDKAGVPLVPGYHGGNQDPTFLRKQAEKIGYPVLIKASAGGGGKGMRIVESEGDFLAALASCKREAASSFGDDTVLLEQYVPRPRHIEIQIFADAHGTIVSLFERDCSVQRRHQKVIEEAPAPGMTEERRSTMGRAACNAAQAVGYVGAGTVEFIVSQDGAFYFMEMNTRLQVEHPVTEMVTGQDLVEWQLRVASGARLPLSQEELQIKGHAIEARIYAEDPYKGFLPSTGRLIHLAEPEKSAHLRIDSGVEQGDEITPYYDPMIAKLVVWDEDRERARLRMLNALHDYHIAGVANNVEFLARLVASPAFAAADLDTMLIERERDVLFARETGIPGQVFALAALWTLLREKQARTAAARLPSPWDAMDGWRLNSKLTRLLRFKAEDEEKEVRITYAGRAYVLEVDGVAVEARGALGPDGLLRAELVNRRLTCSIAAAGDTRYVFLNGRRYVLTAIDPLCQAAEAAPAEGNLTAPMPGKIIALLAEPGKAVEKGTPLLVLEAMKMEHTIASPKSGILKGFLYAVGDLVSEGAQLIEFEP